MLILNVIVLIFEVLYYSLFMYYSKNEGKLSRYILLFSLITIILIIIGTSNLYAYLIFILFALYGLKYIVKCKIGLYDALIIFTMLLIKLLLETPIYIILRIFTENNFILTLPSSITKIMLLYIFRKNLKNMYIKFKKLWDNNNFYIRYIFSTLMFLFLFFSCVFLIFKLVGD